MKHIAKHQKIKNEKVPRRSVEKTVGKSRKVKNPILQTYFTSLLSLILCVSMFFGTSLAWFSSEVQSTGNEILIGTLEADLLMNNTSLTEKTNIKVFDDGIKWEPGYTALRALTVKNTGDLDFTYTLTLTDSDTSLTEEEKAIAENFVVYAKTGDCTGDNAPNSFEAITNDSEWQQVMLNESTEATLADILTYGLTVYRGSVGTEKTDTFTIALHMKEGVQADGIMGKIISLNVKLVAYQKTTGAGDVKNSAQSVGTFVTNAVDLQNAMTAGGTVILADDVVANVNLNEGESPQFVVPEGKNVVLDLNGHNLSVLGFVVAGELIIKDSRESGLIQVKDSAEYVSVIQIASTGSVQLDSGKISVSGENSRAILMYGGKFTMNGGTINAESGADVVNVGTSQDSATATVAFNDGKVILVDATDDSVTSVVENKSYAVYVSNGSATVTVAADMDIDKDDCGTANETTFVTFTKKETE